MVQFEALAVPEFRHSVELRVILKERQFRNFYQQCTGRSSEIIQNKKWRMRGALTNVSTSFTTFPRSTLQHRSSLHFAKFSITTSAVRVDHCMVKRLENLIHLYKYLLRLYSVPFILSLRAEVLSHRKPACSESCRVQGQEILYTLYSWYYAQVRRTLFHIVLQLNEINSPCLFQITNLRAGSFALRMRARMRWNCGVKDNVTEIKRNSWLDLGRLSWINFAGL